MGPASQIMYSFFDTNVLIYMFDKNEPDKQDEAHKLFYKEVSQGKAVISSQVLQEFYNAVTKRLFKPLDKKDAEQAVIKLSLLPLRQIDTQIILAAIKRNQSDQVSFWDALIIETALRSGASILWSEDMQHGRQIDDLKIQNPFK